MRILELVATTFTKYMNLFSQRDSWFLLVFSKICSLLSVRFHCQRGNTQKPSTRNSVDIWFWKRCLRVCTSNVCLWRKEREIMWVCACGRETMSVCERVGSVRERERLCARVFWPISFRFHEVTQLRSFALPWQESKDRRKKIEPESNCFQAGKKVRFKIAETRKKWVMLPRAMIRHLLRRILSGNFKYKRQFLPHIWLFKGSKPCYVGNIN